MRLVSGIIEQGLLLCLYVSISRYENVGLEAQSYAPLKRLSEEYSSYGNYDSDYEDDESNPKTPTSTQVLYLELS